MIRKALWTPDAPDAAENLLTGNKLYSQAIAVKSPSGLTVIHTAGQVALTPDKRFVGGNIIDETHQVMHNLGAILAAGGAGFENVAQARIYLTDMDLYGDVNDAYAEYFGDVPPARECVEVAALPLPQARIEMSMVAYL